ncbi:ferredoxin reductase family protein [Marinobacterium lutimaris]|uniref:Predicted ferric reductase n=1 Tax=Marinobacterium lutimaris TaxID=568106 RepID=A0A1H5V9R9_9GAMM|nr:ferric reductase-like transmembrane domain-containing protein [Marinobacterium lutimaris]SEF83511.1 Predicted ferric reductase [Marinobacterium lutimaris]
MKNVQRVFWLVLLGLSGVWLLADTLSPYPFTYFSFRTVFVQYTGVVGMGMMSLAMMLALRPKWVEPPLDGLDKMYRLHKWLGIGGLVFSTLHWWWGKGTKWMVGWGWLSRPEHNAIGEQSLSALEQWLNTQRGLAETIGEWVFYAAAILIILALVNSFPYHWFRKTHKLLALAYLALVYHSLVLLTFDYWLQPVGVVMALLMLGGSVAAVTVLAGRVGHSRKVAGILEHLEYYPALKMNEGFIKLEKGWPGHKPGQFAFVTSENNEGAHPYTIASVWNPEAPGLRFIVKELGDWTGQLRTRLRVGQPVSVEGPYGCFDFSDRPERQIWVGAGIGITPFIAKLEQLAQSGERREVDLFHVSAEYEQAAFDKLTAAAEAAQVRLHIRMTPSEGRLTPEQIRAAVPEWREASLWFCGPAAFGNFLREDFARHGLPSKHVHQELFAMR